VVSAIEKAWWDWSERFAAYNSSRDERELLELETTTADEALLVAMLARAAGHPTVAVHHANRAVARDSAEVYAQVARYLADRAQPSLAAIYASDESFAAFIRGGGNPALYRAVSRALHAAHEQLGPSSSVLDVGVGDGRALLPGLARPLQRLDLVEPSAELLARATAELTRRGIVHTAHAMTLEAFSASERPRWQLIQATFSLQSLAPVERARQLRWMRDHTDRLLVVEFDVPPAGEPKTAARFRYLVERYRVGLEEYRGDGGLVGQGFLVPMFLAAFEGNGGNFEAPIATWVADCKAAGFAHVETAPLAEYWWAPAVLVDARHTW
jgi:hypothetical protein